MSAVRLMPKLFAVLAMLAVVPAREARSAEHPAVAREMNGVWLPDSRRSTRTPAQWPLTAEALKAQQAYRDKYAPIDPTLDDSASSCIPESMPYPMRLIAQYPFEILFTTDRMTMFFEIYGSVRRIPVGGAKPVFEALPTPMGRSTGHWEGDTLVIETTHVRRDGAGEIAGDPPVSSGRRFIERISIDKDDAGRKQLRNDLTIEDPQVLTAPVSVRMYYKWSPDIEVGEYLCQQDIWDQNVQGSPSSVPWRQ